MQAGVGLLVTDVMPIYMIMPRYSHNYTLFYQLLDSNLFTYRNTYAILREATSETYGPRVYLLSYKFSIWFYLHLLLSNLYHKNTKNNYLIILSRLDLTFASYCEGIENPFIMLGASVWLFVLALVTCALSPTGLIHWFSNWGKYLSLLCCITLSSSREKPTQAQEVAFFHNKI